MTFARIAGTGSYVPGEPVTNQNLVDRGIDTSDEWIVERTGIRARHRARQGAVTSDLAAEASPRAMGPAGVGPADRARAIRPTSPAECIHPTAPTLPHA